MYKKNFLDSCKKTIHPRFIKINRVRLTMTCNIHTKCDINRMYRLDAIVFTHIHTYTYTHMHTHIHAYITTKIAHMNSGDLKMYKCVKTAKSNFFKNAILSLHSICSESNKYFKATLAFAITDLLNITSRSHVEAIDFRLMYI